MVAAAAAVGLALAIVAARFSVVRDTAEPVGVADVITTFREGEEAAPAAASPVPEGVYVYAIVRYEKTDALKPPLGQPSRNGDVQAEHVLLQELADRWTVSLRAHAEHWAAVYPLTWRT